MTEATAVKPCPYCFGEINVAATRCSHCSGELRYCPRCEQTVAVTTKKKFVGVARGLTQVQYRCAQCRKVVDGPGFW